MHRHLYALTALILLAACTTQQETLPTLIPSPAPAITDTAAPIEPTQTPPPTVGERPTLPPTWTPGSEMATVTPFPSNTPAATATLSAEQAASVIPTVPQEVCDAFQPDMTRTLRTYTDGKDATVYWSAAPGAAYYHVALTDDQAQPIFEDYTADTTYTFPAAQFESGKFYGWDAYPVSALGNQMCLSIGAELFPED